MYVHTLTGELLCLKGKAKENYILAIVTLLKKVETNVHKSFMAQAELDLLFKPVMVDHLRVQ